MTKPNVFISYSHLDEPWKDRFSKHLGVAEKQGLLQTWDDRQLRGGDDWFNEIVNAIEGGSVAVLLVSHNSLTSNFILNEEVPRMLAQRDLQKARFYPVVIEPCDWEAVEWLKQFNLRPRDARPVGINKDGFRTEEQINRDLAAIAKEIRLLLPLAPAAPPNQECPYRGLEVFEEKHHKLFFGRDKFIEAIWQKLQARQFVAVVGPSGCGKSSVIQAGVFPRLGGEWRKRVFRPGEDPFFELATELVEMRGLTGAHSGSRYKAINTVAQQIRDNRSIAATVAETLAALPQSSRLLLVADQFEELFTLTPVADRQPFVEALLAAAHVAELKVLVILRADFFGQAISLTPELSQLMQDGVVTHRPLQRADWEAVILQPAKTVGLHVDPALVALILEEIEAQPDSLPLLEYALKELWRQRTQGRLGLAQYEAIGKLAGAINQRADAVLAQLPEEDQKLALRALTRLVRVSGGDEEGADTRLRLPLHELTAEQRDLLQSFINERLLVTKRHDRTGEETIEVAHEALIRRWEKLREALESDREFLVWRRRLNARRNLWEQKGRDDKWLLFGGDYDEAQRWFNERGSELSQCETEFINWTSRPKYQIDQVLKAGPELARFSDDSIRASWVTTLIICGEVELAFTSAGVIENVATLIRISTTLARLGYATETDRVVREALDKARKHKTASDRASALGVIAKFVARAGLLEEAQQTAKEALAAARDAKAGYERTFALCLIVEVLLEVGLIAEAEQTAMDAVSVSQNVEYGDFRGSAIATVAVALAKAGLTVQAEKIADEALVATRRNKDDAMRTSALSNIAESWAAVGLVAKALAATNEMARGTQRAFTLNRITRALAKQGLIEDALITARESATEYLHFPAFAFVAKAMVKKGLVEESLSVARESQPTGSRVMALGVVATELIERGLVEQAQEIVMETLTVARGIMVEHERASKLGYVAKLLSNINLLARAREAAEEALIAAHNIEADGDRAPALISISKSLIQAGMAVEALAVAREIERADLQAEAILGMIIFWSEQGQPEKAKRLVDEMLKASNLVFDEGRRSELLSRLATILARLHEYYPARKTAEQCSRSQDRLAAYTAILREYHLERNPSLARLFAEETTDAEEED